MRRTNTMYHEVPVTLKDVSYHLINNPKRDVETMHYNDLQECVGGAVPGFGSLVQRWLDGPAPDVIRIVLYDPPEPPVRMSGLAVRDSEFFRDQIGP